MASHDSGEQASRCTGGVQDHDGPVPPANFAALSLHLRRIRVEREWSYDELAARSGVGRATLVAIESGRPRRNPKKPASRGNLETWYRIARAFDMPLGELLKPLYDENS